MRHTGLPGFTLVLVLLPALLLSCMGVPGSRVLPVEEPLPPDLVKVQRLSGDSLESHARGGTNPYVPRTSLLFSNNQPVFYVYELVLPAARSFRIKLISATLADESGTDGANLLALDELSQYWEHFLMPDDEAQLLQSNIDRTYFGRTDFNYSSRKGRSYVLVFSGKQPQLEAVIATFKFQINGQAVQIEVQ
ncbi:MAG: hypothetical protein RBT68_08945 [Spirochaetia bacterium]|nr:hypothetical protein [Spirochaetia bacterium]